MQINFFSFDKLSLMDNGLVILLYAILSLVFVGLIFIMLFYMFNKNVLSKTKLVFKICFYVALVSLFFVLLQIFLDNYFFSNYFNLKYQKIVLIASYLLYNLVILAVVAINLRPIKKVVLGTKNLLLGQKSEMGFIEGSYEFDKIEENLTELENLAREKENYNFRLKKEYYKFVPKQFFDFLGKDEIFELGLGENVQKDATILFVDLRLSHKTSESLSLGDNFKFINSYLNVVGECVREEGGFIDKFMGDGVLAIFLNEVSALNCANKIAGKFFNMNLVGTGDKIKFGIGLNCGKVVFGIVGDKERLSPTVISDSVNLAYRIESLNKIFRSNVLLTKEVLNNLPKDFDFNYRYVGLMNIDGVGVSVFESLDSFFGTEKTAFVKSKKIFESAVRNFEEKNYHLARKLFLQVLKINEDDNLAKFYLKKCKIC